LSVCPDSATSPWAAHRFRLGRSAGSGVHVVILGAVILGSFLPFLDSIFAGLHEFLQKALLFVMEMGSRLPILEPKKGAGTFALLLVIALFNLFVYAYPYVEYALGAVRQARKGLIPTRRELHDDSL
jgi:hypothetical protein